VLAVVLFAIAISVDGFLVGIAQGIRGIKVPLSTLIVINTVSAVIVFLSLSSGRYVACWLSPGAAKLIGSGILIAMGALMLKPLSQSGRRSVVSGAISEDYAIEEEATEDDSTEVEPTEGEAAESGATEVEATEDGTTLVEGDQAIPSNTGKNIGKNIGKEISENMDKDTGENTGIEIRETIGNSVAVNIPKSEAVASGITKTLLMIPKFLAEPATADLDSSGTLTLDEGFLLGLALAIDALSVGFGAGMAGMSSAFTPVVAGFTQGIFVSFGLALGSRMRKTVPVEMLEKAPGGILILLGAMRLK
jgi:putative sporulation protein YtaF